MHSDGVQSALAEVTCDEALTTRLGFDEAFGGHWARQIQKFR